MMRAGPLPGRRHNRLPPSEVIQKPVVGALPDDAEHASTVEPGADARPVAGRDPEWTLGRPRTITLAIVLAVLMWILVVCGWFALR
jgi:hypothetical protein